MTFLALLGACLILGTIQVLVAIFGSVPRARVERFAIRQWLLVTPDNGDAVIRYLATTRRWRGGLLLVAALAFTWVPIATRHGVTLSGLGAFVGWFVGAVIAEWRVDHLARGARSVATLRSRHLLDYVGRPTVVLPLTLWTLAIALAVTSVVGSLIRATDRTAALGTLLVMVLAAAALVTVVRGILERPQPVVAYDLMAADDAIRGRSLHALLGSAVALAGYFLPTSTGQLLGSSSDIVPPVVAFGYLVLPLIGVLVALGSPVPRTVRARQRVAA